MKRIYSTIARMLPHLPSMYLVLCRYANGHDRFPEDEVYRYIQRMFQRLFDAANIELIVSGSENIPTSGGFVLYPNHQSFLDIPAVTLGCPRPIAAVMKKELSGIPFIKQLAAATGSQCLDREDDRKAIDVIKAVASEVKAGRGYLVFPEGTRSRVGEEMGLFKAGSFKCATKAKCPIVPVALTGTREALVSSTKTPHTVRVCCLEPIFPSQYAGMKTPQIAEEVRRRIETALDAEARRQS